MEDKDSVQHCGCASHCLQPCGAMVRALFRSLDFSSKFHMGEPISELKRRGLSSMLCRMQAGTLITHDHTLPMNGWMDGWTAGPAPAVHIDGVHTIYIYGGMLLVLWSLPAPMHGVPTIPTTPHLAPHYWAVSACAIRAVGGGIRQPDRDPPVARAAATISTPYRSVFTYFGRVLVIEHEFKGTILSTLARSINHSSLKSQLSVRAAGSHPWNAQQSRHT